MLENFELLFWLLVFIPVFYLGMPLLIRSQQRLRRHPTLEVLSLKTMDPELANYLMTHARALFKLGFGEPTLVYVPDAVPNVRAYLIMLVNRQSGDKAMVTVLTGESDAGQLKATYLEFSTRFDSEELFNTLNSSELSAFPPVRKPHARRRRWSATRRPCSNCTPTS